MEDCAQSKIEKNDEYPSWICSQCARAAGGSMNHKHICAWHMGLCQVCNEWKEITQPRDFGYPKVKANIDPVKCATELSKMMNLYKKMGNEFSADLIRYLLLEYDIKLCEMADEIP